MRAFLTRACISCLAGLLLLPALFAKPVSPASLSGGVSPSGATNRIFTVTPPASSGGVLYDATPSPLPYNLPSLGFDASWASEFGDHVQFAGGAGGFVGSVTVTMSTWAIRSDHPGAAAAGYNHPVTLKLYAVNRSTGVPQPGAVLATVTRTFTIPWRPEPDLTAPPSPFRPWRAPDGNLYGGMAFNLTFDLGASAASLPAEVIVSIGFNTRAYGTAPLGVSGPYDALNVGVTDAPPSVGVDAEPDAVMWKTANPANYADGGASGVNVFRRDTGWAPYKLAVRFNGSTYGALQALCTQLQALHSSNHRIASSLLEARLLIGWALLPGWWDGPNRVQPIWGSVVFGALAEAVDELTPVATGSSSIAPQVAGIVRGLVDVAEALAATAISDAVASGGNAGKIAKAQDEFADGLASEASGRFERAVQDFEKAWWWAIRADH